MTPKKTTLIALLLTPLCAGTLKAAASTATAAVALDAQEVVSLIHHTSGIEIMLGELAKQKGHSAAIRRYGDRLARDHRFADRKIMALARRERIIVLEQEPDSLEKQADQKLQGAQGVQFDALFLAEMEKGHQRVINALSATEGQLRDLRLRDLVGRLLPILKQHHHLAANLQG